MSEQLKTASDIILRPGRLEDAEAVYDLQRNTWNATVPGIHESAVNRVNVGLGRVAKTSLEEYAAHIEHPDHMFQVAVEDDDIVGMVHASRQSSPQELHELYIAEQYHGTGLAHRLMGQALRFLSPGKPVSLSVFEANGRAIQFYKKHGFEVKPDSREDYVGIPTVIMERKPDEV